MVVLTIFIVKDCSKPFIANLQTRCRAAAVVVLRRGLPRSSTLVRIQQFLSARVCAPKVARSANGAKLRT
jgi:hypothetical protein